MEFIITGEDTEGDCYMDALDFIRDMFSQDCTISTVLHLVMAHFNLSEEEAQKKVDEYFEIVEMMDRERECCKGESSGSDDKG